MRKLSAACDSKPIGFVKEKVGLTEEDKKDMDYDGIEKTNDKLFFNDVQAMHRLRNNTKAMAPVVGKQ